MTHSCVPCDMSHSHGTALIRMWHDPFICVTWLIYVRHDQFTWDSTHSYLTTLIHMWHDSFMFDMMHSCATWPIHMWQHSFIHDMTQWYVTMCVWVCIRVCVCVCVCARACVCVASTLAHAEDSHYAYAWAISHISESCHMRKSHVANMNRSCDFIDSCEWTLQFCDMICYTWCAATQPTQRAIWM